MLKKVLKRKKQKKTSSNLILEKYFDKTYYLSNNKDVNETDSDPFEHYKIFGSKEGRDPNRWFDVNYYLETYPDVKLDDENNPFLHYLTLGWKEKRFPNSYAPLSFYDTVTSLDEISSYFGEEKIKCKKLKYTSFDAEFYIAYYDDLKGLKSKKEIHTHWENHGILEERYPNKIELCNAMNLKFDLLELDLEKIIDLNPLLSTLNQNEIFIKILQIKKIDLIRISDDTSYDANFYALLGKSYLMQGEKNKSYQILLYSLYLQSTSECNELIGNYFLDHNQHKKALTFYKEAIEVDSNYRSFWLYANMNNIYRIKNNFAEALEIVVIGLEEFPQDSRLLKILDSTIEEAWNFEQESLHALAEINNRNGLINKVNTIVSQFSKKYADVFNQEPLDLLTKLNPKRVLIIGDFHVPQCIRYRIDQKEEQLELAGYEVSKVSWTDLHKRYEEIFFHDIIFYYRVPAVPIVIKSIEKAKSLGKITFFEIDDLIFDTVYPPAYETYGGNISIEEYAGLLYGMPLFQAAANLCEYAIGSTMPLVSLLEPLVTSNKSYLHRNGLDSLNVFMNKKEKGYVNIFYGSGTLAHNSDFLDLTLEALERILKENKDVKLTIVGHLSLPNKFVKKFSHQVQILEKTSTIEHYWSYLSGADINLAVLQNDVINNSKSELKWFEAACFKIPSVVSNTQNYLDVIDDGEDALIAGTPEEWYIALNKLVKNKQLRDEMGNNAYEKVIANYSLEALSLNIDSIIQTVLDERIINE